MMKNVSMMVVALTEILLAMVAAGEFSGGPLINDPARLNIGFICRWEPRCMDRQTRAMKYALKHVKKYRVPAWKVQVCNRNSSRVGTRKDWIGFDNCIRNPVFRPPTHRSSGR